MPTAPASQRTGTRKTSTSSSAPLLLDLRQSTESRSGGRASLFRNARVSLLMRTSADTPRCGTSSTTLLWQFGLASSWIQLSTARQEPRRSTSAPTMSSYIRTVRPQLPLALPMLTSLADIAQDYLNAPLAVQFVARRYHDEELMAAVRLVESIVA